MSGQHALQGLARLRGYKRPLREPGAEVFIRFNQGLSILKKVMQVESGQSDTLGLPQGKRFDALVSPPKAICVGDEIQRERLQPEGDLLVYQNGGTGFIAREEVTTGTSLIDCWKVFQVAPLPERATRTHTPTASSAPPFVGEPGSICSETLSGHRSPWFGG